MVYMIGKEMEILSKKDILNIPESALPLLVLSDNVQGFISWGIKAHEHGNYNHLMWMHRPGYVVSQGWILKEKKIEDYLKTHRLKFWSGTHWTRHGKELLKIKLQAELKAPWYKKIYDPVQIIGKFFGLNWLQIPGSARICSDHADKFGLLDPKWKIDEHLSPPEVNRELEKNPKYYVYGRYITD